MKRKNDFEVFVDNDLFQKLANVNKALKNSKNLSDSEFLSLRRERDALTKEAYKVGKIVVNK